MDDVKRLRGEGRWSDALEAAGDDPLLRAELLNEQAMFGGVDEARDDAARELDRAEARLEAERGRILHSRFLVDRAQEDPRELEHFEASLAAARRAGDPQLEAWGRFWVGLVYQVVRGDTEAALPEFEAAYEASLATGDTLLQSYAIRHLAFAWHEAGRHDDAWRGFEESLELRRADGFQPGVAAALLALAQAAREQGRAEQANELFEEARRTARSSNAAGILGVIDRVESGEL
ncbi:MAG TPA: tetratricopeptide repeat protein [Gaiellaceae bacterium]|nr:tetratricopeptide repeat protein [Gaiellaceae bacterium]